MNELSPTEIAIDLIKRGKSLNTVIQEAKLPTLSAYLFEFICKKNISVDTVAGLADLNKTSLYRILNGEMNPRPNVLIRLSRVLDMDIEETQKLLKCGNCASLSGSKPRDVYIMDGIIHNRTITEISDILTEHSLPDLFTKR